MNTMRRLLYLDKIQSYHILNMMRKKVNAPKSAIGDGELWFQKYEWNEEDQDEFIDWLTDYLYHNKSARTEIMIYPVKSKKECKKAAILFVLKYGWKTKKEVDEK